MIYGGLIHLAHSHIYYMYLYYQKTTNHFNLLEEKEKSSDDIAQILGLDRPPPVRRNMSFFWFFPTILINYYCLCATIVRLIYPC